MATDRYSTRRTTLGLTSKTGLALAAARDRLFLTWVERETGTLRLASGTAASFGNPVAIDGYSAHSPGLCIDAEGRLVLAWTDLRTGRLLVSMSGVRSVEVPQVLEYRSAHAPAVCLFRERVHLAWTGDDTRVRITSHGGRGWSEPRVVEGADAAGPPALAPAEDVLHLLWRNVDRQLARTVSADGVMFEHPLIIEADRPSAPSAVVVGGRLAAAWLRDDTMVFDPAFEDENPRARETWPYAADGAPAMAALNESLVLAWTATDASRAITLKRLDLAAAAPQSEFTFHGDAIAYDPFAP